MRWFRFPGGFVAGLVLGVLVGSAGLATAAFSYKGWQRFSSDFKAGYVTGWIDMAGIARNLDPDGWIDKYYPVIPQARPLEWVQVVDRLYADPANQEFSMASMLQLASAELRKKYKVATKEEQDRQKTAAAIRRLQEKAREAELASRKADEAKAGGGAAAPDAAAKPAAPADAKPAAAEAKPAPAKARQPKEPKGPKFCRCDDCVPRRPKFREGAGAAGEVK